MTQPFNLANVQTANEIRSNNGITTYGALLLPFDVTRNIVVNNPKTTTSFKNKITSAFKNAPNEIKNAVQNPTQTFKKLAKYMTDNRDLIADKFNTIGQKFSGIAVAQTLIDGKVTSREAIDYLFMGFAPALGVQGSLMGYSGLNQMKEALFDGSINVGGFINGFSKTLKGAKDFADMITNKQARISANVIQFDLTISHSEQYQSETPDRRVQSGQSLNEFIHNMPETFDVQCALQEGKRYSKAEFRAILKYLRDRKDVVQLVLGDEIFDNLVLTNFAPNHDCTKSGMDYTLSFKKVYRSDIDTSKEVIVQTKPKPLEKDITKTTTGGLSSNIKTTDLPSVKSFKSDLQSLTPLSSSTGASHTSFFWKLGTKEDTYKGILKK